MGQLRSALRGLALQCRGPAATLQSLDRFASSTPSTELATVVYAELDPSSGAFRYACAGHPPPVACIDGHAEILDEGRSPLLAAGYEGPRREAERRLGPGSTVVLYTDGLVERRGESFDRGVERLLRSLERVSDLDLESLSDALTRDLLHEVRRDDDVAFLCLRIGQPGAVFGWTLGTDPASLRELRDGFEAWLRSCGLEPVETESVVLAVHEAAANAIEHGYRDMEGDVAIDAILDEGTLAVEIRDHGAWRDDPPDPSRGRGLTMMRALTDSMHIDHDENGTTVRMRRRVGVADPSGSR
jgi:anti-sigma regulatory factor (Ser/Thr protein kinase)